VIRIKPENFKFRVPPHRSSRRKNILLSLPKYNQSSKGAALTPADKLPDQLGPRTIRSDIKNRLGLLKPSAPLAVIKTRSVLISQSQQSRRWGPTNERRAPNATPFPAKAANQSAPCNVAPRMRVGGAWQVEARNGMNVYLPKINKERPVMSISSKHYRFVCKLCGFGTFLFTQCFNSHCM
jgi:hypothetical protein